VAAQNPDVVARIDAYLKTARSENPDWPPRAAAPSNSKKR
jgi:hypothetical protein